MLDPRNPVLVRLMNKVTLNPLTGCWEWLAYKTPKGYGRINGGKPGQPAHNVAYRLLVGDLGSLEPDHTCVNRSCVNPMHLEAVTHKENIRRAAARGNMGTASKRKTHCPQGHGYFGENLHITPEGHRKCKQCNRDRMKKRKRNLK